MRRALLVFEDFLRKCDEETYQWRHESSPTPDAWREDIRVRLERDGLVLDDSGKTRWSTPPVLARDLSTLSDASGIQGH